MQLVQLLQRWNDVHTLVTWAPVDSGDVACTQGALYFLGHSFMTNSLCTVAACGAKEWRDIQWASGGVRQLDECALERGDLHLKGRRPLLAHA